MHVNTLPRLHPITGMPFAPIGMRKDGRAIWPILGGSDDPGQGAGDGTQTGGASASAGNTDQTATSGTDTQSQTAAAPPAPTKIEDLPDWAQKLIRDTRTEAATNRTAKTAAEQKQQEVLDGIAQALGLKKDDAPADPAVLQQSLGEREQRITTLEADVRTKDVELAAWRSASQQNVNAVALLDSRSFLTEVAKLDPATDDFGTQLDAAVKKAVEANPALRATSVPTPGSVGIGVTGSNGDASVSPGLGRLRQAYSTK